MKVMFVSRILAASALPMAAMTAPAPAQEAPGLPVFDTAADMRSELDRLMRDRDFVAAVERFSPPDLQSIGRVRVLEDRLKATLAPLEESDHFTREELSDSVLREVIAYWTGDAYVFVYLLTHTRPDGVRVLDFRITGEVRTIADWW